MLLRTLKSLLLIDLPWRLPRSSEYFLNDECSAFSTDFLSTVSISRIAIGNTLDCQKPLGQDIICTCNDPEVLVVTQALIKCEPLSTTTTYISTTLLENAADDVQTESKSPTPTALAIGISLPCLAVVAILIFYYVRRRRRLSGISDLYSVPHHVQDKVSSLVETANIKQAPCV